MNPNALPRVPAVPSMRWITTSGLLLLCSMALAVEPVMPTASRSLTAMPATGAVTGRDVLLSGDLLHIEVYDNPDLTIDVRIPSEGRLQFPVLGQVDVLPGTTGDGLALQLQRQLEAKYLNRALVTVTVKEYGARRVYVMGGVAKPGAIPLNPDLTATAIRVISEAGGLVDDANLSSIVVMRENGRGGSSALPVRISPAGGQPTDVVLRPNDLILVSRLDRVYVTGQVRHPGSVACNQPNLTVARALSAVGGFDKYARPSAVQLLRPGQTVRVVDVEAILAGNGEDLLLKPGDMLNVPERRY